MKKAIRTLALLWGVFFSLAAFASAIIETVSGAVRAGPSVSAATAVTKGQRIQPGSTVVTGPKSLVNLRFDDGQVILLNENSEFKVSEYSFSANEPSKDKFVFDLFRGAMRSVTGLLTRRTPQAYALRVPQATIGIRGSDFMVALVNPAFMSVLSGAIAASNAAGVATFAAGATATVASTTALAVSIPAAALPASVAASFAQMGAISVTAGAAAALEAVGGLTPATLGVVGAVAAAIAAAIAAEETPGTTGTTGTTGTP